MAPWKIGKPPWPDILEEQEDNDEAQVDSVHIQEGTVAGLLEPEYKESSM